MRRYILASCMSTFPYNKLKVVAFPRLSPTMNNGRIKEWLKREGDIIHNTELFMKLTTNELVGDGYKTDNFKEDELTMVIEAQEDVKLIKILQNAHHNKATSSKEGLIACGQPIAFVLDVDDVPDDDSVVCEDKYLPQVGNTYDLELGPDKVLTWQAYMDSD